MKNKIEKLSGRRWISHIRLLAVGIAFQMFTTIVFAEDDMPKLDEARRLLEAGKAEQSAALLQNDLISFAGNVDYDYLLGLALYQSGQPGKALFAFERVVMADPDNVDARLKAAQISVERGDSAYAAELLAPLSGRQLSAEQQHELGLIRPKITSIKTGPASIRGYILSGIGRDDNVTSGPDQSTLIIPGISSTPTSLGSASRAGDTVGMVEAGLSLRKAVSEDTWLTGDGNLRQGFSRARKDVAVSYANLDMGVLRRSGSEFFKAELLGQDYRIANATYRDSLGARLNWIHPLNDHSWLTSYVQQITFTYPGVHAIDDTARSLVGVSGESTTSGDEKTLQYGVYGGREVAKDVSKPQFSFHILGASLGGSVVLNKELTFSAGGVYELQHHDSTDPLYLFIRSDIQRSVGVAADYQPNERWHVLPYYSYTHNASNCALYDYSRNTLMLQFRRDFDNEKN